MMDDIKRARILLNMYPNAVAVGSSIFMKKSCCDIVQWCEDNLVIDNPEYYKKQKMGKWTGGTPQKIFLFEIIGDIVVIPFGCLSRLWKKYGSALKWEPMFSLPEKFNYESQVNLYDYQEETVNKILSARNGIVVMPCGSGKTQTALEAVARIGLRTLWLTHTQDLLNQSLTRAKAVFAANPKSYGTITGGKVNIGDGITFATIQTMAKLDMNKYTDEFGVVIVDECQHCCGSPTKVTQFYKVVSSINARYKIGLTATPDRADGMDTSMYALLGNIIHEVSREQVAHTTCPIEVRKIETGYVPDYNAILMGDGTINYAALVDDMIENEDRYFIVFGIIKELAEWHPVLILANRVSYIERMNKDFIRLGGKSVCISTLGQSKKAKEERKRVLSDLNDGKINAVFATYQLAKEGLDVPNLRYVVFATPEKDQTTVIQSAGRVGRKAEGKEKGIVIDFVDDFGMYRKWSKQRDASYRKIDAEVIE